MILISKQTLREIRSMVQNNDHGGAFHLAATALGQEDLAAQFDSINRRQQAIGHLPYKLYEERFSLYLQMMSAAKAMLPSADYQVFHGAF